MCRIAQLCVIGLCWLVLVLASTVHADDARRKLCVLTYNIKHGRGMDGKVDLERAAAVVNRLQPDLVALQEVDRGCGRSGSVDQAAELGKLTSMHHAFGAFFEFDGGEYGMAILSKQPIISVKNLRLPAGTEPRTALIVHVQPLEGGPEIVLANVHFYQSEKQRLDQARALLQFLKDESRPVVIAGDFNSQPDSAVLQLFADGWTVPAKDSDRFTFPSLRPRVEIDFIMFRPGNAFEVRRIDVVDEEVASDHRPVMLELLTPGKAVGTQ